MNKAEYYQKLLSIINDNSKFKPLPEDPTEKREASLQRYLRFLKNQGVFSDQIYERIRPCGSNPARIYGLPKIHKEGAPLRPIVSAIGSYTHKLAKFLTEILQPLASNKYTVKDSFSFSEGILSVSSVPYMCSFDVVSLFTNIPINETIDICLKLLFKNKELVHNLTKTQFKKLLIYCVKQNHFVFNGKIYDQIDGVAMGSPLGPVLANIFMAQLEEKALQLFNGNKPDVYNRYVDDTFLIFNCKDDSIKFFDYMNTQHKNIKFTVEPEHNDSLSFLDVLIKRLTDGSISTSIYRKDTFSGLYMKYNSFVPPQFKRSLVYGLLNRCWRICSSYELFKQEYEFVKQLLICNGFPVQFINRQFKNFMSKKVNRELPLPSFGPEKRQVFLFLPYCGINSIKLKRQLERLINAISPWSKLCVVFKPIYRLKSLSKLKSNIPLLNRSNVIYQVNCSECKEFYIGLTTRRVHKRLDEHRKREYCSIFRHSFETDHSIDFTNPKILSSDSVKLRLQIKETLLIQKHEANKSLNVNLKSFECKLW